MVYYSFDYWSIERRSPEGSTGVTSRRNTTSHSRHWRTVRWLCCCRCCRSCRSCRLAGCRGAASLLSTLSTLHYWSLYSFHRGLNSSFCWSNLFRLFNCFLRRRRSFLSVGSSRRSRCSVLILSCSWSFFRLNKDQSITLHSCWNTNWVNWRVPFLLNVLHLLLRLGHRLAVVREWSERGASTRRSEDLTAVPPLGVDPGEHQGGVGHGDGTV